jgi:hypothetical protein
MSALELKLPLLPRFNMKWLLVGVTISALWCSTVTGYSGNEDVRGYIGLLTVVACVLKTYCSRGRQRCFWLAFSLAFCFTALFQGLVYVQMHWVNLSVRPLVTPVDIYGDAGRPMPSMRVVDFFSATIKFTLDLFFAMFAGFVGSAIHDCSPSVEQE